MAGDVPSANSRAGDQDQARPEVPDAPLALYRRYRPATFAEVRGQEHVTEPLRQALRSGRVNHAYLFSGPRGCGKTSSARILARSLNCEKGPTPDPCGTCASCVALAPTGPGSIDVIEIDAASHGGIDDARDLRERAFYSPVAARYKVYIIDEAHMVTGAGFNALLKLVEEPPPHLKFVFATTEPEKVIPTIRSRTHHYPFRLVPPAVLRELLEEILRNEQISYEPTVLPVVIRAGAGSVRDSLSVLDQLIAGADESGLRYDRAIALLGYTDDALLDEMTEAFAARDGAAVFLAIGRVVEAGHDPRRFATDLLDRLRDLIVLAAVPGAGASGLLDASEDQIERMRKQAAEFGADRLAMAAETISNGLVEMRGATSPRLLLELMCAQVLLPASAAPDRTASETEVGDLAARIERLERQLAAGGGASRDDRAPRTQPRPPGRSAAQPAGARPTPAPPASAPSASAPPASAPPAPPAQGKQAVQGAAGSGSGGLSADDLRSRWPDVLEAVRDVRKTAWILLSNYASIDTVDGNVLTMAFDSEGNARGFASSGSDGYLAAVIDRMFGVRPVIRAIVNPAAAAGAGRSAARRPDEQTGSGGVGHRPAPGRVAGHGADYRGGDRGDSAGAPGSGRRGAAGDGGGAEASGGAAAIGRTGRQPVSDDAGSGRARAETQPARTARSARGGQPSATARPRRPPGADHTDDPRPFTDAVPGDGGDALTGSDLVMRELGGQVIDDV
ncbi:MAG TPA: DNA polymerase III subunit gamma and tau [Streptosporangiaceae bacterium]|nr:DNA polymerase III subunit gamma and tau [Streptosporangiaceae bacterium]